MSKIKRKPEIRYTYSRTDTGDNAAMMLYDPNVGETYILDNFGAFVWELIDEFISFDHILKQFSEIYEGVDRELIRQDLTRIVTILKQRNLLEESEE